MSRDRSWSPRLTIVLVVLAGLAPDLAAQGPAKRIAYQVPEGLEGNQEAGSTLGMDFDVQLDILITRIGVFDSYDSLEGSYGLNLPITARLFDRDTLAELGVVEFTPDDPGDLVGGSRFKELEMELAAGFRGTIVASGYGPGEPNGNQHGAIAPPLLDLGLDDGDCAILFTGGGRFGNDAVSFPNTPDGGPPNRYAAGTFEYVPQESFPTKDGGIAYFVPAGTVGNQFLNVSIGLGMDFDANVPILVTRLGVFDSGQDGLFLPIAARIFHRETGNELASLVFTPEDPGELVDGSRFKDLVPPLKLPAGFPGTIVGENYGQLEPNGNQGEGPLPGMALESGGCAITFRGGGRVADVPGTFPTRGDGGPPNRYAAGTFELEIDPAPPPPAPAVPSNLKVVAGDKRVDLTWDPSAGEPPAAKYLVFRGAGPGGPFKKVAEVTEPSYADAPLPNDVLVCYSVRAVSAGGIESFESARKCGVPTPPLPPGRSVAYGVPQGTEGNQDFGGALGMDFDVLEDIRVFRLGVFDDGSDGLNLPIAARIFDRDTAVGDTATELAVVSFTPDEPGALIGGSRFVALDEPLDLLAGFHGTMVASGYGAAEMNGNTHGDPNSPLGLTTDDGGCRISFVGTGRFGNDAAGFPGTADGGPPNRYAAGTFDFEALGPPIDPTPQAPSNVAAAATEDAVVVTWTPPPEKACVLPATSYKVLRSTNGGPYGQIAEVAGTSYTDEAFERGADLCYAVLSVAGPATESGDSLPACAVPGKHIAYVVPSGTAGARVDGVPLGMDFDVELDVQLTRLGAFDSAGDGLARPITVKVYDRDTEAVLAAMDFTPEDPGTLLNSSRFKRLDAPVEVSAGTRCSVVAEGYGDGEPAGELGPWTTDPGPCSLFFVGKARSGVPLTLLPPPNADGRTDQYAAGTFEFVPRERGTPRGTIAYQVPPGTVGNQVYTGALGMDFNVNVPIKVTRLGVFDSGSDGIKGNLRARLYDRDAQALVAELRFSAADPGELVGGSRFKPLDPAVELAAGFHGTMVGAGYNANEPNGNYGPPGGDALGLVADDGGCAITFVGGGRFGGFATVFPATLDGGPANRYAAGTFELEAGEPPPPVEVFHRGDADQNKQLQLTDAIQVLGYLVLGAPTRGPECFDAADADDNGSLQLTDAVRILGFLFLGGAAPPPPFDPAEPVCGADPTPDDLGCASFEGCP
ncbi:MAG: fibronectin type III domain-containing protein [Planctomycetes bacterium]|nr:fibronectin type III domain-containing protein [Planctomycetota bacterium]